jgi:anthranilate phosphoribosyltransferase
VNSSTPGCLEEILGALLDRCELSRQQMRRAMQEMIAGRCGDAEAAAVLIALRMKGETAAEIAAAAEVLREAMVPFETGRDEVIDTCGTGGDAIDTFNISTATALVVAAAGLPVVKHGNRAVSSQSGSADVLAALGVAFDAGPAWARRSLDEAGLAFCFAPQFHPALKNVADLRKRLGVRTLFNCLGPLANPARAPYQLIGVGRPELLDPIAGALARLGTRRAFVVSGRDGLGEVTLTAPTRVREVRGHTVAETEWTAAAFQLEPCTLPDLRAHGPKESAALVRKVLSGEEGPAARVVLANAAAALLAAGRVRELTEGVALARTAIGSGRAAQVLERLIECSKGP